MRPTSRALCTILLAGLATGCGTVRLELGRRVDPFLLESNLRIGQSTRADVLAALGAPRGEGRAWFPMDAGPRTVWSYAYGEAMVEGMRVNDTRELSVWVYFDGDRYDGYLWFSTLPKR